MNSQKTQSQETQPTNNVSFMNGKENLEQEK